MLENLEWVQRGGKEKIVVRFFELLGELRDNT
jgi:hypothetical protein